MQTPYDERAKTSMIARIQQEAWVEGWMARARAERSALSEILDDHHPD